MLCVENLHVEVNIYVTPWSYTLTEATSVMRVDWLRQRHHSYYNKTQNHQHDSEADILKERVT